MTEKHSTPDSHGASSYDHDAEKQIPQTPDARSSEETAETSTLKKRGWLYKLSHYGVEIRGIEPVPIEEKIKDTYVDNLKFWTSLLTNFLPISTGMVGTLSYGMSLRDASLVIIFFNMLCFGITAWAATMGMRLGFRQMIHARYSYG